MDKAFILITFIIIFGIFLYFFPDFAGYFGFESLDHTKLSAVVLISEDNGNNFKETYWAGNVAPTVYDFETDPTDPSFIYAATDQGFFMSRDQGQHWYRYSDLEGQLTQAVVYQIQKAADNPNRIFVSLFKNGQGGIYETQDRFFTLKKIFDTEKTVAYKLTAAGGNLYFGLSDGRLISYSSQDKGFSLMAAMGSAITDIVTEGSNIYVATRSKETWLGSAAGGNFVLQKRSQISQSAYAASLIGVNFDTIVAKNPITSIMPDSQGRIYLASGDKLYRSVNQGGDWQLILDVAGRQVSSLNLETSGRIMVGTSSKTNL